MERSKEYLYRLRARRNRSLIHARLRFARERDGGVGSFSRRWGQWSLVRWAWWKVVLLIAIFSFVDYWEEGDSGGWFVGVGDWKEGEGNRLYN